VHDLASEEAAPMPIAREFATAVWEAGAKISTAAREIAHIEDETSSWVQRFIYGELAQRASKRGGAYWEANYPNMTPEQRAEARMRRMFVRGTVATMAAAAGASAAEVMSIATDGAVAPVAVPFGLLSMGAELLYTTALQIDLAFDLASIYGVPFAPEDVGEISTLLAMPLGVPLAQEPTRHDKPANGDTTKHWRVVRQMQRGDFAQEVGSKLVQLTVLRNVVPIAGILVGALGTQILLRRFAYGADALLRHRRAIVQACRDAQLGELADARTILDGAWLLATACGDIGHAEALAMSALIDTLPVPERIGVHDASFTDDEVAWYARIADLPEPAQDMLIEVLSLVASADGELRTSERRFLRRVGATLKRPIDLSRVERMCELFQTRSRPQPSRGRVDVEISDAVLVPNA
jgi:hypothetical protein